MDYKVTVTDSMRGHSTETIVRGADDFSVEGGTLIFQDTKGQRVSVFKVWTSAERIKEEPTVLEHKAMKLPNGTAERDVKYWLACKHPPREDRIFAELGRSYFMGTPTPDWVMDALKRGDIEGLTWTDQPSQPDPSSDA